MARGHCTLTIVRRAQLNGKRGLVPAIQLTQSLLPGNEENAVAALKAYFIEPQPDGSGFTGALFDTWDPSGNRSESTDSFTADDVVAVSLLSVDVAPRAAVELLIRQRPRFEALLKEVGPDRDLASVQDSEVAPGSAAWRLSDALRALPQIGPTTASKLMARKRPRLLPVYDSVIEAHVLGGSGNLWRPLRAALRADNGALHQRLLKMRERAFLDEAVSPLRIFDVVAWMDGTGRTS